MIDLSGCKKPTGSISLFFGGSQIDTRWNSSEPEPQAVWTVVHLISPRAFGLADRGLLTSRTDSPVVVGRQSGG